MRNRNRTHRIVTREFGGMQLYFNQHQRQWVAIPPGD
jgi:hypothetical protein